MHGNDDQILWACAKLPCTTTRRTKSPWFGSQEKYLEWVICKFGGLCSMSTGNFPVWLERTPPKKRNSLLLHQLYHAILSILSDCKSSWWAPVSAHRAVVLAHSWARYKPSNDTKTRLTRLNSNVPILARIANKVEQQIQHSNLGVSSVMIHYGKSSVWEPLRHLCHHLVETKILGAGRQNVVGRIQKTQSSRTWFELNSDPLPRCEVGVPDEAYLARIADDLNLPMPG